MSHFVGVLMGFAVMVFVPRSLGPVNFGYFEFVTDNFTTILTTLSLSFPSAYFYWISRKGHKENCDVATGVNILWHVGVIIFFAVFLGASVAGGFHSYIWPKIPVWVLWSGLFFAGFSFLFQFLNYIADGRALTVDLERFRMAQNILRASGLAILFFIGFLTLRTYFLLQTSVLAMIVLGLGVQLARKKALNPMSFGLWRHRWRDIAAYLTFTKDYVKPLLWLYLFNVGYSLYDRWFLQVIGGPEEQGFYGIAFKFGALAFIFTSAMTPILTREFAHAYEEGDKERLRGLFNRIQVFLFIATVCGVYISVQSGNIVRLVAGKEFLPAVVPISIMALYPIHQTFGQLSAALLLSTGQTRLFGIIGILVMVLGVPLTYFLIAPRRFPLPGMEMGAMGLAIKMIVVQIIGTNLQLYFNARYLGFSFAKWLWFQARVIAIVYTIAGLSKMTERLGDVHWNDHIAGMWLPKNAALHTVLPKMVFFGMTYFLLVAILITVYPSIAGISCDEIKRYFIGPATGRIARSLRRRKGR